LIGLANIDDGVGHLLRGALPEAIREHTEKAAVNWGILFGSLALAFAGIGLAWLIYGVKVLSAERLRRAFRPAHTLVEQKYYMDHLYERGLVEGVLYRGVGFGLALFDGRVVDGFFDGVAWVMGRFSAGLRWVQSGQLQAYGAVAFAGLLLAVAIVLALNPP
jgi:NADH-quinone oxidoreductase subunit L